MLSERFRVGLSKFVPTWKIIVLILGETYLPSQSAYALLGGMVYSRIAPSETHEKSTENRNEEKPTTMIGNVLRISSNCQK